MYEDSQKGLREHVKEVSRVNKGRIAAGLLAAVMGCGLLWTAGNRETPGIAGWEALNVRMEQAMGLAEPAGASGVEGSDQPTKNNAKTVAAQAEAVGKVSGVTQAEQAAQPPVVKNSTAGAEQDTVGDGTGADGEAKSNGETKVEGEMISEGKTKVDGEARTEPLISEPAVAASSPAAVQEGKVNVNVAGVTELMELPGIGEKKAQAIIDYRNLKGAYHNLSDLGKVKGIGPKMLEKLKALVIF